MGARRHWHAFHNAWATYLSEDLNERLPPEFFAEANVQFAIEIDVAAFEETGQGGDAKASGLSRGGWTPPAPMQTIPFPLVTDAVEVNVFHQEGGPVLAGAIELVSPANKDGPAHRQAFVSKCETYLQQSVGLVIVDVVTQRKGNLHDELLQRFTAEETTPLEVDLYAVAYRPVERDGNTSLDMWPQPLAVGRSLPTLPLWLRGGFCIAVDLDATYERTCRKQRVLTNGA